MLLALVLVLPPVSASGQSRGADSLPPYPFAERRQKSREEGGEKARKIYQLVKRVNPKLKWNDCIARQAYKRARWLVEKGYFDHVDPSTGENPAWDMILDCVEWRYVGENLSSGYGSAQQVHDGWMASPGHRKNILNRRYNLIGIGCYGRVCVQLFAGV